MTGVVRRRGAAALVVLTPLVAGLLIALELRWAAWAQAVTTLAAALTVLVGAPRRGVSARPWALLGAGLCLWGAGMVAMVQRYGDRYLDAPMPNLPDAPRLAGGVLLAFSVVLLAVARVRRTDWVARVDSILVATGAALVLIVLVWPGVEAADIDGAAIALTATSLVVSVGLAGAVARLALTGAARTIAGRFVIAGMTATVVGSVLVRSAPFGVAGLELASTGLALGAVGPMLLAAGAVHPGANRITDRQHQRAHDLAPSRLGLLVTSAVGGPVFAIVQQIRGEAVDGVVLGVGGVVLVILLAVRLQIVVRSGQRQAAWSVIVRDAALAIGAANDLASIRRVTLEAATELIGPAPRYTSWLVANERGAVSPQQIAGTDGEVPRERTGLGQVLADLEPGSQGGVSRHLDDTGGEAIEVLVIPVPTRTGGPVGLAIAATSRIPEELEESLATLGTQCALAIDALRRSQELSQKRSEARFQQLVRHSSDAVLIMGRDGRIRYQTPSVVRVLGYLTVDLDGVSVRRLVHPEDAAHVEAFVDNLIKSPTETVRTVDAQLLRADDSVIHAEIIGLNLLDNTDVDGIVLTIRDVSGRRTLEDQLRHQAFHDSLTGLANRALFLDRVEHGLNRVRRDKDSITPAVAFVDLDDFKMVNDSLGHAAGDRLLQAVAERLTGCLRSGDTPARLGGDEFAILLEDARDIDAVIEVAERVLDSLESPIEIEGREIFVRASIGIATRRNDATTPDELLRNADLAMYTAKANGKGCIELFEPTMHHRAVARLALRGDLERAVERDEIDIAYQPILRLDDGALLGFEALARWTHPERGIVSPAEFVPVAEDTGVIVQLGRVVLQRACLQLARWRQANAGSRWDMSVNMSARQLMAPDLIEMVKGAIDGAGIEPSSLVLELTEATLLSDTESILRRIHRLKDLGVQIAIDDFGSGYSSLSYLQRVPFDILKIDRAFVAALRRDDPATTLVRTITDLARTLGRATIAEGIEQQIEVDGLLELGCEVGQGYLLRAPSDASTIEAQLGLSSASA